MPSFEHKQIAKQLTNIDTPPAERAAFLEWVRAGQHLQFLEQSAHAKEMVVYASPKYAFIYSMAVPEELLEPVNQDDLMGWSTNPFNGCASYVWGGGRDDIWVERDNSGIGSKILSKGTQLIYGRTFEGWSGDDSNYFELSQEYAHLEDLHWRPEQKAYCKFDDNGDLAPIVSITKRNEQNDITLITFEQDSLEQYLTASNQVLVRMFDFTLLNHDNFSGWDGGKEEMFSESDKLFFKQRVCGPAAYTRGVQIIRPSRSKKQVYDNMRDGWSGNKQKDHVELIAYDWRNECVRKISTDPAATTNYFEAKNNDLPFELSPAFFKPEVLLKYKADKDKYKVGERDITCRASWYLKAFDVNEAGQVFAYLCYLRNLPQSELLHWLSYNEEPKASISERAFTNDFQGEFVSYTDPLEKIKNICREWGRSRVSWWSLRDERLLDNSTVPLTSSRDEWGDSFLALTQLINEGFITKAIRKHLADNSIEYDKQDGSLALIEKAIRGNGNYEDDFKLSGLRMAQLIRTKTKGHSAKADAESLAQAALSDHENYASHFRHVCEEICEELSHVQEAFQSF